MARAGRHMRSRVLIGATITALVVVAGCVPPPPPQPQPPRIEHFDVAGQPLSDPALVPFTWQVRDPDGDALVCRLDGDGDGTWDVVLDPCASPGSTNLPVGEGEFTATLEVTDGDHPPVAASVTYPVSPGPTEAYDIELAGASVLDADVRAAFDAAAARWESVVVRGVPDQRVTRPAGSCGPAPEFDAVVDDLVVAVLVAPLDGPGGTYGRAAPCVSGPESFPGYGFVQIDSDDVAFMSTNGFLVDLMAHEIGHVLGFGGPRFGEMVETFGAPDPVFVGPRAVAEWWRLGGDGGVPAHVPGDHWSEDVFRAELMTPYIGAGDHPLSALTIAALGDIGYHVDLGAADAFELPSGSQRSATAPGDAAPTGRL